MGLALTLTPALTPTRTWQAEALEAYACEQEVGRAHPNPSPNPDPDPNPNPNPNPNQVGRARQQAAMLLATIDDEEAAERAAAAGEVQLEASPSPSP